MEPRVIYEDECLLAVDKPSGMVVNNAKSAHKQFTLYDWIRKSKKVNIEKYDKKKEFVERLGIVHRLDKDTSGLLLIAKKPEYFRFLQDQFKKRLVKKTYLALVSGVLREKGVIDAPIRRNPFNRRKFGVFIGGKSSLTEYIKVDQMITEAGEKVSLAEVYPKTGRTHQIRVHFKHINCPVISDLVYGGRKKARQNMRWCPRLFLHALKLEIKHPGTNKKLQLKTELAEDLKKVLEKLKKG